jgi:hypothetical protein
LVPTAKATFVDVVKAEVSSSNPIIQAGESEHKCGKTIVYVLIDIEIELNVQGEVDHCASLGSQGLANAAKVSITVAN